jgi:predicted component of type VI protein secretion system
VAEVREARLFVLAGPDLARSFPLGERSTLGRSDECDVVLRDRSISRKHAALVRQGETWFVQDLGSTNGVSKDGRRGERFELADGDEFKLGDLPLRLRLVAPADVAADVEFVDVAPVAAAPAPPAPARPAPRAAPADVEDEIEIEDEIVLEGAPPDSIGASGASAPRGSRAPARALDATVYRAPRAERRSGFFAGDLEQRPLWVRGLIVLVLLALCAALAYGAFFAVRLLREGL